MENTRFLSEGTIVSSHEGGKTSWGAAVRVTIKDPLHKFRADGSTSG